MGICFVIRAKSKAAWLGSYCRLPFLFPGIPLYLFAGSVLWEWGWWLPLFCFWVFLLVQDPSSLELEWCYFQGPPWVFLRLFFCSLRSRLSWRKYCKDLWTSLENVLRIFPRGPKEKLIKPDYQEMTVLINPKHLTIIIIWNWGKHFTTVHQDWQEK